MRRQLSTPCFTNRQLNPRSLTDVRIHQVIDTVAALCCAGYRKGLFLHVPAVAHPVYSAYTVRSNISSDADQQTDQGVGAITGHRPEELQLNIVCNDEPAFSSDAGWFGVVSV